MVADILDKMAAVNPLGQNGGWWWGVSCPQKVEVFLDWAVNLLDDFIIISFVSFVALIAIWDVPVTRKQLL